ncbi:hypothetical protein [Kerstersia similis]|uniref:hypothetical protein n=1 Tax=Kerstersia similis TaxID=206505 RepID=UPI0039EF3E8C
MSILIPGALPDSAIAPALAEELEKTTPRLVELFRRAKPLPESLPPALTGCTPEEVCRLRAEGFRPAVADAWASGLGPLLHPEVTDDQPVWLAEFAHIAMGTDQVNLIPLPELQISAEEDAELSLAAGDILVQHGLAAQVLQPGRWALRDEQGLLAQARSASPATVARDGLLGWWNHDPALRPWRRVLNEIQMAWHEHPVNEARAARGLVPVNGLWLYGGSPPWPRQPGSRPVLWPELQDAALAEDWGRWLQHIKQLEARLAPWLMQPGNTEALILTGRDRLVTLQLTPRPWWQRWLPVPKHEWKNWWQLRA